VGGHDPHTVKALLVSLGEEHERLGVSLRGLEQPFTVRVLPNTVQDGLHGS